MGSLLKIQRGVAVSQFFPPLERAVVKSLACDLPRSTGQPLARYSLSDLARRVEADPAVRPMSRTTVWRILATDVQRKVLTPNDFTDLKEVSDRLLKFESYYAHVAKPFDWKFTTTDLEEWYERLQGWQCLRHAA